MPVEEQTQSNADYLLYNGTVRKNGQRLTIPDRTVTKLAFYIKRVGNPIGNLHYAIKRTSDDSTIIDEVIATADEIGLALEWKEHEWSTPPTINEEVRIYVYVDGGGSANAISVRYQNTDVKADEYRASSYEPAWLERTTEDTAYRYTYGSAVVPVDGSPMAQLISAGLI